MNRTRFRRNEEGAVGVELGLTIAPFVVLVLAVFEIALIFFALNSLQMGARELASMGRGTADPTIVITKWRQQTSSPFAPSIAVKAACFLTSQDYLAGGSTSDCAHSRYIQWTLDLDASSVTPLFHRLIPNKALLAATSVSYRGDHD